MPTQDEFDAMREAFELVVRIVLSNGTDRQKLMSEALVKANSPAVKKYLNEVFTTAIGPP